MKAIVIGCGRVGSTLARTLADEGWEVTVIELDEEKIRAWVQKGAQPTDTVSRLIKASKKAEYAAASEAQA